MVSSVSSVSLVVPQGLLPELPAILLVGGGEGMGKLRATVEQLDSRLRGSAQVGGCWERGWLGAARGSAAARMPPVGPELPGLYVSCCTAAHQPPACLPGGGHLWPQQEAAG
jgi:hypothetical protein